MRPDHLRAYGYPGRSIAPTVDAWLGRSVLFGDARTTQARTFVAFMSILTGQYPVRNGARENLYPVELVAAHQSIGHLLKRVGYQTVFAMDESRFANIGAREGFTEIVAPPTGTMDFLIGGSLDTSATNLAQLLPYSYVFMPHVAGNRAAANVYRPEIQSARLSRVIANADKSRPLFLVAHFCLAHEPYARDDGHLEQPPAPFQDSPADYRAALAGADGQVATLLANLRTEGRLDNAVVVMLSDHGEGLGMAKDSWRIVDLAGHVSDVRFYGHGAPAFGDAQNHVVLGMQRFKNGRPMWAARKQSAKASLVDIAPTVMQFVPRTAETSTFDGVPLMTINGVETVVSRDRPIFVESGLTGLSLHVHEVHDADVANEFSNLYRATADGRLELKPRAIPWQLRTKERAVYVGEHALSTRVLNPDTGAGCWLVVDVRRRQAACTAADRLPSDMRSAQAALCTHFASDQEFSRAWCGSGPAQANPASTPARNVDLGRARHFIPTGRQT